MRKIFLISLLIMLLFSIVSATIINKGTIKAEARDKYGNYTHNGEFKNFTRTSFSISVAGINATRNDSLDIIGIESIKQARGSLTITGDEKFSIWFYGTPKEWNFSSSAITIKQRAKIHKRYKIPYLRNEKTRYRWKNDIRDDIVEYVLYTGINETKISFEQEGLEIWLKNLRY